jgi:hypothetical protein
MKRKATGKRKTPWGDVEKQRSGGEIALSERRFEAWAAMRRAEWKREALQTSVIPGAA